ncbi:hypothetical protein MW887_009630 [Aspergillus wentii]|nr:hypothetical protein MW887_009630 [Aspergillus wentii]
MLLLGYLILPVAFEADKPSIKLDSISLTTVGMVFIAVAYALSMLLGCILYSEPSFLLQSLYLPCLYSSLLGLFSVVFNILCRNLYPVSNLQLVSICLSGASGFLYALAGLWMYGMGISAAYPTYTRETRYSRTRDDTALLTEDEQQRQQLLRLLKQKEKKKSSRISQKTFQVSNPEHLMPGKAWGKGSTPPPTYC